MKGGRDGISTTGKRSRIFRIWTNHYYYRSASYRSLGIIRRPRWPYV